MIAIDPKTVPARIGTSYPAPYDEGNKGRHKRALGNAFGLVHFGVNLVRLPPGEMSSQRHWHENEDELVWVLEGEVSLITDAGEEKLRAGMCAGFPAGKPDGHHLVNRSGRDVLYLEVGTRAANDRCHYPDIDLRFESRDGEEIFTRKDGTPL